MKVAALLRREKKLLANIEEMKHRIVIGEKQGKEFRANHHINVKVSN